LAVLTILPDRSNRMNDMTGREPVSPRDLGVAGLAAVKHPALGHQIRPRFTVDGAVDPTTAEKRRIGRVDDRVNAQGRNIGNDDFETRLADLALGQAQTAASTATPLSAKSCCNSPAWNISRMMSQPPTNSPLT